MRRIQGEAKTIRQLLSGAKYSIDYYQREYKWQTKHVIELIEDITVSFSDDYKGSHARSQVETYSHYFLGAIIISNKDGKNFIVDGQQRLTTLTLLLIYLNNLQLDRDEQVKVSELIYSEKFGKKSFNIDVEERRAAIDALYAQDIFDENGAAESVKTIIARYRDIEENFPDELKEEALPYFMDWMIENIHLVEITAYSDEDAYTVFETMNDRGLSLTPTDMLKGFLLNNVNDEDLRWELHSIWKNQIHQLAENDEDDPSDFFKAWLRGQYAKEIRERKRGASPKDFDRIGTEFHRWVRDKRDELGLEHSEDYVTFIQKDLSFFAKYYRLVRKASVSISAPLEDIFYISQHGFTLQYPLLMSPLTVNDTEETAIKKLRIVAAYLDILLARRLWNWRTISYSTLQYAMFIVMRDIRQTEPAELVQILLTRLDEMDEQFSENDRFAMHGQNRTHVQKLLARMTEYIEVNSGMSSRYLEYISSSGRSGYEVEHIWANHPERHADEFDHPTDFLDARNRIGGLLLLPRSFNASYGDLPYEEKLPHYNSQNLLARSLNPLCYERNPGFVRFIEESGLPFRQHESFGVDDLEQRQSLINQLAEIVWGPNRLKKILDD